MDDKERQGVAEQLYAAVADGSLSLDEFGDRIGAAYAAATSAELAPLVADLPTAAPWHATTTPAVQHVPIGAIKRGGRWRLAAETGLSTTLGPVKLDLTGAELVGAEVALAARTVIGTIKVWVPHWLRVVVEGQSTIGTRQVEENHLPPELPVPTLRLRLDTWLGTVKVYRT